jgi:hypothetical protein
MKYSRAQFKYALRKCKASKEQVEADATAKPLMCKDYDRFWQDIKHKNNSKAPLPNCIDSVHGSERIVQL